jgi:hypothetical protein
MFSDKKVSKKSQNCNSLEKGNLIFNSDTIYYEISIQVRDNKK